MDNFKTLIEQALNNISDKAGKSDTIAGIPTGFKDLDRALGGFDNADLIVVGARPAMGKSALLLNMAVHQAVEYRIPVLFYSFEKTRAQIVNLILSSTAEIEGYRISGGVLTSEEILNLGSTAKKLLDDVPLYIVDKPSAKILQFCQEVKDNVSETNARIVYIDNLQLFSSSLGYQNRYEEIAACTRELKHLAKELGIPVVIASQINRNPEHRDAKYTDYYRPYMYDLRDSGTICEDSNVVILLDRPELKYRSGEDASGNDIRGLVEVNIAKNHMGPETTVKLHFKPRYARFEDWEELSTPRDQIGLSDDAPSPF